MAEDRTREISIAFDSQENDDNSPCDIEKASEKPFDDLGPELMKAFIPDAFYRFFDLSSSSTSIEDSGNDVHALQRTNVTGMQEVAGILHQLINTFEQWLHETPEGKAFLETILLKLLGLEGAVVENWLRFLAHPLSKLSDRSHPHFREIVAPAEFTLKDYSGGSGMSSDKGLLRAVLSGIITDGQYGPCKSYVRADAGSATGTTVLLDLLAEQWFARYHVPLKMAVNFLHGGVTRLMNRTASKGLSTFNVAQIVKELYGTIQKNVVLLGQWLSGTREGLNLLRAILLQVPEALRPREQDIKNLPQVWTRALLQHVQLEPLTREIERWFATHEDDKLVAELFYGGVVGLMNNGACQGLGELDGKTMIREMANIGKQTVDSVNQWLLETTAGKAILTSSFMELLEPMRHNEHEYRLFLQMASVQLIQLKNTSHPLFHGIERLLASDRLLLTAFVKAFHGCLVWSINHQGKTELLFVNALRILYEINEKNNDIVPRRLFWLQGLEAHHGLASHFVQYTKNTTSDSKSFTWIDAPFLLNVRTKWKFTSLEAIDIMERKMLMTDKENNIRRQVNKTVYASWYPQAQLPIIPTCLRFYVDRENIVESALKNLEEYWQDSDKPNPIWLKPLEVNFEGESAIDLGGPSKDFFHHLFSALLTWVDSKVNIPVFKTVDEHIVSSDVWFNPDYVDFCTLEKIGLLFALLIFNGAITTVPFPALLYEKLLSNRDPVASDLEVIDKELVKQLYQLRDMAAEDLKALDLDFEGLQSGDKNVTTRVTKENIETYITETMYNRLAIPQLRAFAKGFDTLASLTPIMRALFKAEDLRDVILGEELDWIAFRQSARYIVPYHRDHRVIQMFWKVFQELEERDKRRFLKFLTGADHVPLGGFVPFPVRMLNNRAEKHRHPIEPDKFPEPGDLMPEVMTCKGFLSMDLPEYKTEEDLRFRLMMAMNTDGFHREGPNRLSATAPCCRSPMLGHVVRAGMQLVLGGMR